MGSEVTVFRFFGEPQREDSAMGGHVRIGLEDNNKTPDGKLATNYDLVKHVVEVAKVMGREIATPAEAREILSMPPAYKVTHRHRPITV